jgi:iron(III) transport system ATP-binding protein
MAHPSSPSGSVLEVKDVSIKRGDSDILTNVSFALEEGEIAAILGPSGCGKTSLMRALAGLEKPRLGQIGFRGQLTTLTLAEAKVGFVPQSSILLPWLTAQKNAELLRQCRSLPDAPSDLHEFAVLMGLGNDMLGQKAPTLSGGQQQRIALMRALLLLPELLLLDESFSSIDTAIKHQIIGHLRNLLKDSTKTKVAATVLVTHDHADCLLLADTIYSHNDEKKRFERIHSVQLGSDRVGLSIQDDHFVSELRALDLKIRGQEAPRA